MSALRLADLPTAPPGAKIDDSPLRGCWRNPDAHALAPAIATAQLVREAGGPPRLRMRGVDGFDWGEAIVDQLYAASPAATTVVGYTASFAASGRRARIQANIKLGVMVLAGFVTFDDDAQPPCFIRDFMYSESEGREPEIFAPAAGLGPAFERQRLVGRWQNTLAPADNRGIASVEIDDEHRVSLHIVGAEGPARWGPVRCAVHECWEEDRVPGTAAIGRLALDELDVELQLRVNKGILCVMTWTSFSTSTSTPARHAWVTRELFAREERL